MLRQNRQPVTPLASTDAPAEVVEHIQNSESAAKQAVKPQTGTGDGRHSPPWRLRQLAKVDAELWPDAQLLLLIMLDSVIRFWNRIGRSTRRSLGYIASSSVLLVFLLLRIISILFDLRRSAEAWGTQITWTAVRLPVALGDEWALQLGPLLQGLRPDARSLLKRPLGAAPKPVGQQAFDETPGCASVFAGKGVAALSAGQALFEKRHARTGADVTYMHQQIIVEQPVDDVGGQEEVGHGQHLHGAVYFEVRASQVAPTDLHAEVVDFGKVDVVERHLVAGNERPVNEQSGPVHDLHRNVERGADSDELVASDWQHLSVSSMKAFVFGCLFSSIRNVKLLLKSNPLVSFTHILDVRPSILAPSSVQVTPVCWTTFFWPPSLHTRFSSCSPLPPSHTAAKCRLAVGTSSSESTTSSHELASSDGPSAGLLRLSRWQTLLKRNSEQVSFREFHWATDVPGRVCRRLKNTHCRMETAGLGRVHSDRDLLRQLTSSIIRIFSGTSRLCSRIDPTSNDKFVAVFVTANIMKRLTSFLVPSFVSNALTPNRRGEGVSASATGQTDGNHPATSQQQQQPQQQSDSTAESAIGISPRQSSPQQQQQQSASQQQARRRRGLGGTATDDVMTGPANRPSSNNNCSHLWSSATVSSNVERGKRRHHDDEFSLNLGNSAKRSRTMAMLGSSPSSSSTSLFYPGRTGYGGRFNAQAAAAHPGRSVRVTPLQLETQSDRFSNLQQQQQQQQQQPHLVTPTAKKILDALDRLSTPLTDARRIPSTPYSGSSLNNNHENNATTNSSSSNAVFAPPYRIAYRRRFQAGGGVGTPPSRGQHQQPAPASIASDNYRTAGLDSRQKQQSQQQQQQPLILDDEAMQFQFSVPIFRGKSSTTASATTSSSSASTGWQCLSCMVTNQPGVKTCTSCTVKSKKQLSASSAVSAVAPSTSAAASTDWRCSTCMCTSPASSQVCVVCQEKRPSLSGSAAVPAASVSAPATAAANAAGEWRCDTCMCTSPASSQVCVVCQEKRPSSSSTGTATMTSTAAKASSTASAETGTGEWRCNTCMCTSPASSQVCVVCQEKRPLSSAVTAPVSAQSSGGMTKRPSFIDRGPATVPIFSMFSQQHQQHQQSSASSKWQCDTCLVENVVSVSRCVACESPRPGAVSKPSSAAASGSDAGPKISFGAPSSGATSDAGPKISFGAPSSGTASDAGPKISFGAPSSGTASDAGPKISFGAPSSGTKSDAGPKISFGAPSSGTTSDSGPNISFGASSAASAAQSDAGPKINFGASSVASAAQIDAGPKINFGASSVASAAQSDAGPKINFRASTVASAAQSDAGPKINFGASSVGSASQSDSGPKISFGASSVASAAQSDSGPKISFGASSVASAAQSDAGPKINLGASSGALAVQSDAGPKISLGAPSSHCSCFIFSCRKRCRTKSWLRIVWQFSIQRWWSEAQFYSFIIGSGASADFWRRRICGTSRHHRRLRRCPASSRDSKRKLNLDSSTTTSVKPSMNFNFSAGPAATAAATTAAPFAFGASAPAAPAPDQPSNKLSKLSDSSAPSQLTAPAFNFGAGGGSNGASLFGGANGANSAPGAAAPPPGLFGSKLAPAQASQPVVDLDAEPKPSAASSTFVFGANQPSGAASTFVFGAARPAATQQQQQPSQQLLHAGQPANLPPDATGNPFNAQSAPEREPVAAASPAAAACDPCDGAGLCRPCRRGVRFCAAGAAPGAAAGAACGAIGALVYTPACGTGCACLRDACPCDCDGLCGRGRDLADGRSAEQRRCVSNLATSQSSSGSRRRLQPRRWNPLRLPFKTGYHANQLGNRGAQIGVDQHSVDQMTAGLLHAAAQPCRVSPNGPESGRLHGEHAHRARLHHADHIRHADAVQIAVELARLQEVAAFPNAALKLLRSGRGSWLIDAVSLILAPLPCGVQQSRSEPGRVGLDQTNPQFVSPNSGRSNQYEWPSPERLRLQQRLRLKKSSSVPPFLTTRRSDAMPLSTVACLRIDYVDDEPDDLADKSAGAYRSDAESFQWQASLTAPAAAARAGIHCRLGCVGRGHRQHQLPSALKIRRRKNADQASGRLLPLL
uniref:Nuclear pore complex protein Nup153 n=1 Tax=Macrostomum lignano TaxID=282301 RepID=A0A1I8I5Y8_9PLAT